MKLFNNEAEEKLAFFDKLVQIIAWIDQHPSLYWFASLLLQIIIAILSD